MTETDIQNALFRDLEDKGHTLIVPNVKLWSWEADLISVTKAGYVYEYEIKCTRADFLRDQEKKRHKQLSNIQEKGRASSYYQGPSRFFYVVPAGVVEKDEMPVYAGLLEMRKKPRGRRLYSLSASEAPRLHGNKIEEDRRRYLARGLMHRYWEVRSA